MIEIMSIVLPIFIIFGFGYFLKKKFHSDISTLSNVGFFCLLPALVFKTFYTSSISGEIGWLVVFELALLLVILLITVMLSKGFRFDKASETALLLGSSFSNAGNYGSSIILLAYGQEGFEWAIAFFVIQSMLMNSFGVFLAAQDKAGYAETFKKVAKMPALYAGVLGYLFQTFQLELHPILYRPIELLSGAMIPLLMLTLGMQLATIKGFSLSFAKGITLGVSIRLLVSPIVAFVLLRWFPFNPLAENVLLLQAAMPAAVVPTLLAIQYNRTPEMVSGITLFSTLISGVSISVLLFLLK